MLLGFCAKILHLCVISVIYLAFMLFGIVPYTVCYFAFTSEILDFCVIIAALAFMLISFVPCLLLDLLCKRYLTFAWFVIIGFYAIRLFFPYVLLGFCVILRYLTFVQYLLLSLCAFLKYTVPDLCVKCVTGLYAVCVTFPLCYVRYTWPVYCMAFMSFSCMWL